MPTALTAEQIVALAPDSGVAQSGRGLANARKWQNLGQTANAVWGECQGSGKDPYRVQVDLREPAFRCSCPSRKFPCKHGVALLLLLAAQPASFPTAEPPAPVAEWLAKRDQTVQRKSEPATSEDAPTTKKRAAEQTKRTATRETNVAAGLHDLSQWLDDLVRQGLAAVPGRGAAPWDAMAARMIDAQAPGLARTLRAMAGTAASGEGWQARLLEQIARAHLLIAGFTQRDHLPPPLLATVRSQIGWTQDQDSVRANPSVRDTWLVLGQTVEEEDQLRVQRTWLWGVATQRPALLLAFAAPGQQLERALVIGTALDAELVFFDGVVPLRALVVAQHATLALPQTALIGYESVQDALHVFAGALAHDPWLEQLPLPLRDVVPLRAGERWYLRDQEQHALPLAVYGAQGWRLLAASGGEPIAVFGTWNGAAFAPLGMWAGGQFLHVKP